MLLPWLLVAIYLLLANYFNTLSTGTDTMHGVVSWQAMVNGIAFWSRVNALVLQYTCTKVYTHLLSTRVPYRNSQSFLCGFVADNMAISASAKMKTNSNKNT